jgi:hypothetical protein
MAGQGLSIETQALCRLWGINGWEGARVLGLWSRRVSMAVTGISPR